MAVIYLSIGHRTTCCIWLCLRPAGRAALPAANCYGKIRKIGARRKARANQGAKRPSHRAHKPVSPVAPDAQLSSKIAEPMFQSAGQSPCLLRTAPNNFHRSDLISRHREELQFFVQLEMATIVGEDDETVLRGGGADEQIEISEILRFCAELF
jgi:hypothetical protein